MYSVLFVVSLTLITGVSSISSLMLSVYPEDLAYVYIVAASCLSNLGHEYICTCSMCVLCVHVCVLVVCVCVCA